MATTKAILTYPWRSGGGSNKKSSASSVQDASCSAGVSPEGATCSTGNMSEFVAKVARSELREDDSTREHSLQQMREWLAKNRDVEDVRTDDVFLLRFLRVKKFSVPMAQQMLLKYLNLRKHFPHFSLKLDYLSPKISAIIDNGYLFVSPIRDKYGRRVVFCIAGNFDPYKYTNEDQARVHLVTYESLLEDPDEQVLGLTHVGDLKGSQAAHVSLWTVSEFAKIVKWGEHSMPMRHKQMHALNMPTAVRYVYDFAKTRVTGKIKERVMIHQDIETMHQHIDKACLPAEYGGTIPIREMVELWKIELAAKRDRIMALDHMKILSDRGIITSRNPGIDRNNNANGGTVESLPGSFRKLEID